MGCTKRIAEIYVQSLDRYNTSVGIGKTSFVTTRFGNVLGSNGSVIPIFKEQISKKVDRSPLPIRDHAILHDYPRSL